MNNNVSAEIRTLIKHVLKIQAQEILMLPLSLLYLPRLKEGSKVGRWGSCSSWAGLKECHSAGPKESRSAIDHGRARKV